MSKIILVENNLVENHTGRMENWSKIHEFLSKIRRKLKDLCKPAAGPRENHLGKSQDRHPCGRNVFSFPR